MSSTPRSAEDLPNPRQGPDPHGLAALLLMDSLIHALIDTGCLTNAQAIEVVQDAATVHAETTCDAETSRRKAAVAILDQLANGLRADRSRPRLV